MVEMKRRSPVVFPYSAKKTETRDDWTVVMEYESQGEGPWVIDLSHRPRWDIQDSRLSDFTPFGMEIAEKPGHCRFENGILVNRMNRTQASIWQLAGERLDTPPESAYTDTTDGTLFIALVGKEIFAIAEKLSALDFLDPSISTPWLFQGPFSHVPCQMVLVKPSEINPGILLTCSRGYAKDMAATILQAGDEFKLRPAGESVFNRWLNGSD